MTRWATEAEVQERFERETFSTYDFRVYDEDDNGEFLTFAKVDLIERGKVVQTEEFTASSEDAPGPAFSAYGNGRDNHAGTQARSFAWAWIESRENPYVSGAAR
jgi:hypothetical protein